MSRGKVIETIYGKHSKYEITEDTTRLMSKGYNIYRDGKLHKTGYDSLARAVEVAKAEG